MPTRLWKLASILVTAAVLLPAGMAVAHPFTAEAQHKCRGADLGSQHGVIAQELAVNVGDTESYLTIYVLTKDSNDDAPLGTSVWTEANGRENLQRTGFACTSPEHEEEGYIDHSDDRLL